MRIIYGFHNITASITSNPTLVEKIYINQNRTDKRQQELLQLATSNNIPVELVDAKKLDNLAGSRNNHQGVAANIQNPPEQTLEHLLITIANIPNAIILILDGITDPQNLGAIIRTADCFGVSGIIIPRDNSASFDNDTVIKISSGAVNHLPLITVNNLNTAIDKLKQAEFWIAGTVISERAVSLCDFKHQGKIAWVMGSEGTGIRRLIKENCDYHVTIPMFGHTQSLNVSVATGVVLAHTKFNQQ